MNTALRFRLTFNNELVFINNTLSLVPVSHAAGIAVKLSRFRNAQKLDNLVWLFTDAGCVNLYVLTEHEWVLPIRSLYGR